MTYIKTTWKDRSVASPNTFTMTQNADGTVTLTPVPGTIIEAGTPISADNMNNIENGISQLNDTKADKSDIPIGVMMAYGGASTPDRWLLCQGQAVSRTTYARLFAVIGTAYGVGDGSTTFNLPNKKGRISIGLDTSQTEFNAIGKTGGEKAHVLTIDEIPSHAHAVNTYTQSASGSAILNTGLGSGPYPIASGSAGGGQAHNNLQPYQVDNWIIKAS